MPIGDHLCVSRGVYSHHGINLGRGRIIHYSGEPTAFWDAEICITTWTDFAEGREVQVLDTPRSYSRRDVVRRARSRLGERRYHLLQNNCEHFARWCRSGEPVSDQVRRVSTLSRVSGRLLRQHGVPSGAVLEALGDYLDSQEPWNRLTAW